MSKKKCLGCGVFLQSVAPERPGYLPPGKEGAEFCQRCYRLRHYGIFKAGPDDRGTIEQAIGLALAQSDLILLVADLFDPEGSLPVTWLNLLKLPVLLVVNKADLLPERTSWNEMTLWFQKLWNRRFPQLDLLGVRVLSARGKSSDAEKRINDLKQELAGKKVTVLGAANVGKTSLLTALLTAEDGKKAALPTVSRFPGTTLGYTSWILRAYGLTLYDTPGFLPGARMGDLLSPETAARLLPVKKLQVKLWNLPPDGAVLGGGLVGFWNRSPADRTLVFFTGEQITLHRSRGQKAEALHEEGPDWLRLYNRNQRPAPFVEENFTVEAGEDLYVSGFGWVAVKKETARLRLLVPSGVEVGTRPSLVGRRDG
ncbi:MAG TPA: GTPase RsgA [Firmicutes bacterium]|nr:GTPase RsgA [Bacillota bacterium]